MKEQPRHPDKPGGRQGWRLFPVVVCMIVAAAAGVALSRLLWPAASSVAPAAGHEQRQTSGPNPAPTARLWPAARARAADLFALSRVVTNLMPAQGSSRAVSRNVRLARNGVAGGVALPAAGQTGRRLNVVRDLPVFQALRAGVGRPIDPAVAALARQLTANCRTEAERARALYDWVTGHIAYDWQEWANIVSGESQYLLPHDPLSVIKRGTTICAGYAWLYNDLAHAVGLDATFIIGDVRGYRGTADDQLVSPYQHAWNSVKIDGTWSLMDLTWGARQKEESDEDYQARSAYYFRTPANQMVFDHLPEAPEWQLLANPVPAETFLSLPNLKPAFFRDGLRLGNAVTDTIIMPAGSAAGVILSAPEGIQLAATLTGAGGDISPDYLVVSEAVTRWDILIAPLPPGDYLLRLYSKPASSAGPFECCVDYAVRAQP